MAEEHKSEIIKPGTSATSTASAQVTQPGKPPITLDLQQQIDGMPGLPGLGKLYATLGLIGTLVVVFAGMIWNQQRQSNLAIENTQRVMDTQLTRLTTELSEARKESSKERLAMVQNYLDSRKSNDARHSELVKGLADNSKQLDKFAVWIEQVFGMMLRERTGSKTFSEVPKMNKMP